MVTTDTTPTQPAAEATAARDASQPGGEGAENAPRRTPRWITALRWIGIALLVAGLVWLVRVGGGYVPRFVGWVDALGPWGPVAFVLGYALATVAFIPGSVLTLAGGAIFGLGEGVLYVFLGATLGAIGAFLVARYVARRAIERKVASHPRFAAVDRAIGREGRKIVFLLRLSPVFPFVILNYALGLTRVRLLDYVIASIGMLPGTLLYVYYGKLIGDVAALASKTGDSPERGWQSWTVLALGLLATAVVTAVVTRIARNALRENLTDTDTDIDAGR
jgi:uncharacterized membrane protein YdjX (TVP38/TMEM64 family)